MAPSPGAFSIPIPRHELFLDHRYRHPFCRRRKFGVVLTDYGHPFRCRFCVMPGLGYKQRTVENVAAECGALRRLGIRDLLFLDQTFGVQAARTRRVLAAPKPLGFQWTAFTRVDVVEDGMLQLMKAAGCHTLILGVESGSEAILKANRKDITRDRIRRAFQLCRRLGIRTVATFILGLPEETHATVAETFAFIRELQPDFCSFNVAVPRQGTALRQDVLKLGLADARNLAMDQSGTPIAMRTRALTQAEVASYLREAIRFM